MLPCAVRARSLAPSLRKVLRGDGNVEQKLGCGFQVPVGSVDVDVAEVGSQGQHVLPDSLAASWRRLQGPDCQRVTKLMNPWPSAAGGLDPSRFQQGPEHAVNLPVHERLPCTRNEDVIATASRFLTVRQVASQPGYGGGVQRHQSSLLKLRFADQQPVGGDVGD